ncbi:DoxX family protein [Actinomadura syzygii]|uniref:DoxX family protein n=1 Tax=Actinomadura syzygii TaxID=1427538 RepID=A0A5D0UID5_9ACTN|nr:DoxX family protein [Actinomadura syzygii]TYC17550.1 DoxX family protein [Actinomadura syzygii]
MTGTSADLGLLALRLVFGLYLAGHGLQKFGLLGGAGLAATSQAFDKGGFRPGRLMAAVAATLETGCGLALVAGLATPAAAATAVGVMLVACSLHVPNGLWESRKGVELPVLFAAAALGLLFTGPGRVSIDHLAGIGALDLRVTFLLLAVVLVGVAATLARRAAHRRAASPPAGAGSREERPANS